MPQDEELRDTLRSLARTLVDRLREPLPGEPARNVTDAQRRILEALADETIPAKRLARQAEMTYNSWFRESLAELARRGLIARSPDGYRRA